ncbi:hypothetical protein LTR86_002877 [Recurvomyces mirabilis]|nr:hypothetical protein LTR86_002877 [Recurvomyces mirabilis]
MAAVAAVAQSGPATTIVSTSLSGNTVTGSASPIILGQPSYTGTFTVTTPTTSWAAPTFSTAAPVPTCSDGMCTGSLNLNGQTCIDESGITYGVLCNMLMYGIVIDSSGKRLLLGREDAVEEMETVVDKRDYAGFFASCVDFCDNYGVPSFCTGVAYDNGYCMSYDTITGTYQHAGGIAAVRQG